MTRSRGGEMGGMELRNSKVKLMWVVGCWLVVDG